MGGFRGTPAGALGPEEGPGRSQGDVYIQNVGLGESFWGQNEAKTAQKYSQKSTQKTTLEKEGSRHHFG